MLKELVRERLIAAADEIVELFEKTIASYVEQLCRAREESERHRRQLQAVCKTRVVIRVEDVEEAIGHQEELAPWAHGGSSSLEEAVLQPPHMKEEDEDVKDPHIKEEEEANLSQLRLTAVSVENANSNEPECSQLHHHSPEGDHFGGPPPVNLLAPLSHSDDTDEPLRSNADCQGDDKQPKCAEKATLQKKPFQKRRSQPRKKYFSCSICGKAFAQDRLMIEHKRTHKDMSQIEKHFNCSVCSRPFTQKGNLNRHMRTHTGEKPFSCSFCEKAFTCKSSLERHMSRHTGENPFSCSLCEKTFICKFDLERHLRTHTGEKPFSCSLCEKTFAFKANLERHKKIHGRKAL